MGRNSAIEWCDHTFSGWWGCTKCSVGCNNCYAERTSVWLKKAGWGDEADRVIASDKVWAQPLRWNRWADKHNTRLRVFSSSMSDVFEERDQLIEPRSRLFDMIEATPKIDWLLLTKRPQNVNAMIPDAWSRSTLPRNVAVGTTVESNEVRWRIMHLLEVPAHMRFLSCEPMIGRLDLRRIDLPNGRSVDPLVGTEWAGGYRTGAGLRCNHVDWLIAGGESGRGARPMHPDWARSVRDDCAASEVSFFFKQWGAWQPCCWKSEATHAVRATDGRHIKIQSNVGSVDRADEAPAEWQGIRMVEKKKSGSSKSPMSASGCRLDGAEHKALPKQSRLFAA
jgi:protein gp37